MISQVRLSRKFSNKKALNFQSHLWLILRTQLVFELMSIVMTCIINLNLHFHLSNIYTAEFWSTEKVAASNFSIAVCALLMVLYFVWAEDAKGRLIKDLQLTVQVMHALICTIYTGSCGLMFWGFVLVVGVISAYVGEFTAMALEQRKLIHEITQIEKQDRSYNPHDETSETFHLNTEDQL